MTQQEILRATRTKTWKIQQLLNLGLTRRQVADTMNVGYGFVQNVYAKLNSNTRAFTRVIEEAEYTLTNFRFNHTFGVEIEAFGISQTELRTELAAAGINIAIEGYNHTNREHWKIVTDASLRGTQTFELVSPKLKGEAGLRILKTVILIVRGLEAKVNKTCGLHIHFDAEGFNLQTWKNLYKNYAKVEQAIDSFMPESRRANNNRYCRSIKNIANLESKINNASDLRELARTVTDNDRYYKLNSESFWRHKSVEFRQHSATVSFEKINNWILFLARLIEYSKQTSATKCNWEAMKNFLPDEIINYYQARKRELAS